MIRVLHVDDEVEFLDLVGFFLKREGDFEVDTATDAESALEKMQSQNYDAVVADYVLPRMDGLELLKILRAKGSRIPFILFTGRGKEDTAVQALNYGADFYLQKVDSIQREFAELANMIRKSVQSNRSDEAAREGERFLASVFSSIQDGISILDRDLNIVRVNHAMEDWYSHRMPLVGKKCYDAYHGRQAHCDKCPSIKTIESGKSAYEVVPKAGPKGEVVGWLDLFSFPMIDGRTGELSGVIEYVRDITDRRRYEEALETANQKLNLLGQVTRHDALNQLAVLMGWLQLAQENVTEPPAQEYLKNMSVAAETIGRQLDFTGDYQEMGVAKPEWIDVKMAFIYGTAGLNLKNISTSVSVEGLQIYADPMLEKVFHNFVDNSIRHGKRVTEIRIHYVREEGGLKLLYEDDGVGIPDAEKSILFERGHGDHTGFGLFMASAILGITGITIAENGRPGEGARFEMLVPRNNYRIVKSG